MTDPKISTVSRLLLLLCAVGLVVVLFVPMWRIDLQAPQYPEGLQLLIYPNKLAGNVDIINGLNHYIGMKTLHSDDFIEFKILPFIIGAFAVLFLAVAIAAKRKWMNILCVLFIVFGIVAMVDFWRWEYDYGHNLDPGAAIIVPGMAYQPPLIGFKQLLNFGAYSIPAIGGWIFVGVGIVLVANVLLTWQVRRKALSKARLVTGLFVLVIAGSGCSTSPQPIRIGKDNCEFCKMSISDDRFGAEIVSKKGKVFKFDDAHCVLNFVKSSRIQHADIDEVYFTDFNSPHDLLRVNEAHFLQSPDFRSPMNGNIAAFRSADSLEKALPVYYGNKISWQDMQK